MSYKQMKYYQDLGDYAAAYDVARRDWAEDPSLQWPKNTIAWLLIKMMKSNARAYAWRKFIMQLEEFRSLAIPADEKKLWGAVAWPIRDIVKDSLTMQWFTPEFGDALFEEMRLMPFDKPSDSYSAIGKAFAELGGLWTGLPDFFEWWGFDSFTDFDYRRYPENGRLESLVEKVYSEYIMALHRRVDGRQPSKAFFDGLGHLALHSKEQADNIYKVLSYGKE